MSSRQAQAGAALLIALMAMALVVVIAAELSLLGAGMASKVKNRLWYEQQYQHMLGADARALQRLRQWYGQGGSIAPVANHLDAVYELPESGHVTVIVRDWQGRFNLNSLAVGQRSAGASGQTSFPLTVHQRRFVRLLQAMPEYPLDEASAVQWAARITDWIDADSMETISGAAEFDGQPAPNHLLASLAELRSMPNMDAALYDALANYVMAWPSTNIAINVNAASMPLLRALPERAGLQPVSLLEVEPLQIWQQTQGFATLEQFQAISGWQGSAIDSSGLAVQSSLFALEAAIRQDQQQAALYSLVQRSGQNWEIVWQNPYGY